jgi:nucleotide-binding universal stress UspA family protein
MKRQILVPLDGSTLAETALPHAITLARATSASLLLLRVVSVPTGTQGLGWSSQLTGPYDEIEAEEADAQKYLDDVALRLHAEGLDVQTAVHEGDPAKSIVSCAEMHPEITTIAMATHGRSGPARWFFGSIAEAVLHASPVPLLLVRSGQHPVPARPIAQAEPPSYETILVPLDGSDFAEEALDQAESLAYATGASLLLVSVAHDYPEYLILHGSTVHPPTSVDGASNTHAYLEQMANTLRAEGLRVATRLQYGAPADGILKASAADSADLIVMSTHGREGLQGIFLGSVALGVVRSSDRPVLLVRAKERVNEPEKAEALHGAHLEPVR